jgi:hypothetical protein
MTSAHLRAFVAGFVTGVVLVAASAAWAAPPKRCDKLHGRDLVTGRVVLVVRLKLPTIAPRSQNAGVEDRTGLFSCRLPNGPVHRLATDGRSYFTGQRNTPVESSAVRIGANAGRFVAVTEGTNTLIGESFLTARVVDATTGQRRYTYLNISAAAAPPSLAPPLRTLLNPTGAVVALFPVVGADGSQTSDRLVAFTSPKGQVLDAANDGSIPAASITLAGNVVTWTDAGVTKSATVVS